MKKTIEQKGFIQIPILIAIIASIIATSFVVGGVVLYKQGKIKFTASTPNEKNENNSISPNDNSVVIEEIKTEIEDTINNKEETKKTVEQSETIVKKPQTETNTGETEAYREAMLETIKVIISKYNIEQDFCKGMIDFANLRITNRERLKADTANIPDTEIATALTNYYEADKKPAEEMLDSFTQLKNMIQDQLDVLNKFSNDWVVFKGTISKDNFNKAISETVNPHSKLVTDTWNIADKLALAYKGEFDESDKFIQDSLARLLAISKSATPRDIPASVYISHNDFSGFNFLDYVYKTQQLEALQNISYDLSKIANSY